MYFNRVLVANRGEIAYRIIKTLKKLDIEAVSIYHPFEKTSKHVIHADITVSVDGNSLNENYLNIYKIIEIAKENNCDAIHPGYGFLSENSEFAKACKQNNKVFIGPSWETIEIMGNKIQSKEIAKKADVPVLNYLIGDYEYIKENISELNFPIIIKAASGGGGRGMRLISNFSELEHSLLLASKEAKENFGDGTVYVEEYLYAPKHIEVQVLGDNYGNVIHLYERDCSIQRRYQKVIEEAPSALNRNEADKICSSAIKLAKEINYTNAGTVEFLYDKGKHYFLEMNTRIQVEHPVTEEITGIDIVEEQIKIAAGEKIQIKQEEIKINSHSIEARLYAEDPDENYTPSPGIIKYYEEPKLNNIRIDGFISESPHEILPYFDPQISKIISKGKSREEAIQNLINGLNNTYIFGIKTNKYFLQKILSTVYKEVNYNTHSIDNSDLNSALDKELQILDIIGVYEKYKTIKNCNTYWSLIGRKLEVQPLSIISGKEKYIVTSYGKKIYINGNEVFYKSNHCENKVYITYNNKEYCRLIFNKKNTFIVLAENYELEYKIESFNYHKDFVEEHEIKSDGKIYSDLPGKVVKINVKRGGLVDEGTYLLSIESMKIEHKIKSPIAGTLKEIYFNEGDIVNRNDLLIEIEKYEKEN